MTEPSALPTREAVRKLSISTVESFNQWRSDAESLDRGRRIVLDEVRSIARFYERRQFHNAFETLVKPGGWSGYLASVFLSYRQRDAMLGYLRFQECAGEFEGEHDPLEKVNQLLNTDLRRLGTRSLSLFGVMVDTGEGRRRRVRLPIDPFACHRRVYTRILRARRTGIGQRARVLNFVDRHRARCELALLKLACRVMVRMNWIPLKGETIVAELGEVFGCAEWGENEKRKFKHEMEMFIEGDAWEILEHTSEDAWLNGGAGKFVKLAIGTMLGCVETNQARGDADVDSVIRAMKTVFYWALTYPLVDDVLDQGESSLADRQSLARTMREALSAGGEEDEPTNDVPPIAIAMRRLLSIPGINRKRVSTAILAVLEAHVDGATPRLESVIEEGDLYVWLSLEKSLLVRVATSEISGIPVPWKDYQEMAGVAYFNQLGDDLWDAEEDLRDGAITPVTMWARGLRRENPSRMYVDFGAWLSDEAGNEQTTRGIALAIVHTFSLSRGAGPLTDSMLEMELEGAFPASLMDAVPHIDPDSMLFEFERLAVREYKRWGTRKRSTVGRV